MKARNENVFVYWTAKENADWGLERGKRVLVFRRGKLNENLPFHLPLSGWMDGWGDGGFSHFGLAWVLGMNMGIIGHGHGHGVILCCINLLSNINIGIGIGIDIDIDIDGVK